MVQATAALITTTAHAGTSIIATVATGRPSCFTKVPSAPALETKWVDATTPNSTNAIAAAPNTPMRKPRNARTIPASQIAPTLSAMMV
ncbi:MAG TPA: hypothetical protein VGR77_01225 [Candidatus Dormibacteraeota bacterium]|nr:hypothetical protein [Candidatus Dormibacteraeota bacterium]